MVPCGLEVVLERSDRGNGRRREHGTASGAPVLNSGVGWAWPEACAKGWHIWVCGPGLVWSWEWPGRGDGEALRVVFEWFCAFGVVS